jgi:hypothetical protein
VTVEVKMRRSPAPVSTALSLAGAALSFQSV